LKVTPHRLRVLAEITQKNAAISQPDLEKILGREVDRVTLYRILSSFEEKGIVHKIFDLNGTATYAICSAECSENHHHDQHVHFLCSLCNDRRRRGHGWCLSRSTQNEIHPSGWANTAERTKQMRT